MHEEVAPENSDRPLAECYVIPTFKERNFSRLTDQRSLSIRRREVETSQVPMGWVTCCGHPISSKQAQRTLLWTPSQERAEPESSAQGYEKARSMAFGEAVHPSGFPSSGQPIWQTFFDESLGTFDAVEAVAAPLLGRVRGGKRLFQR
jgi:hypothetical protein